MEDKICNDKLGNDLADVIDHDVNLYLKIIDGLRIIMSKGLYLAWFDLNLTDFLLEVRGQRLKITRYVLNMTGFVLKMTGFVLNMSRFYILSTR